MNILSIARLIGAAAALAALPLSAHAQQLAASNGSQCVASTPRGYDIEAREAMNGPTGVVKTNKGTYRFARIGTFEKRLALSVRVDDKDVDIEDMKSVQLRPATSYMPKSYRVTLRDGRQVTAYGFHYRTPCAPGMRSMVGGANGVPFVQVLGTALSEMAFEASRSVAATSGRIGWDETIEAIEFDEPDAWEKLPGGPMQGIR